MFLQNDNFYGLLVDQKNATILFQKGV